MRSLGHRIAQVELPLVDGWADDLVLLYLGEKVMTDTSTHMYCITAPILLEGLIHVCYILFWVS